MYHGQVLQDKFLNEQVFKGARNGFFVEIGASDGLRNSNTAFFEKELDWKGICIEPLPDTYQLLVQNRSCDCLRGCAFNRNGYVRFKKLSGYTEQLSGVVEAYPSPHLERIRRELAEFGGAEEDLLVRCFRLEDILDLFSVRRVNFLSIDTEGAELQVLQGINFQKVLFDVIEFEENYPGSSPEPHRLLSENGYEQFGTVGGDVLYCRKDLLQRAPETTPAGEAEKK